MKTTTKTQKIIRWASNKATHSVNYMSKSNGQTKKDFKFMLNRLVRAGLVTYTMTGQKVKLNLTQTAYYGRAHLI